MKIHLLAIGKEDEHYQPLIRDFSNRINHYTGFSVTCIAPPKISGTTPEAIQKEKEGILLLKHIGSDDEVLLLDERGKELTSVDFAAFLNQRFSSGRKTLTCVIGGAFGVDEAIRRRANHTLSLSRMTLPHLLVRLFFTEQLYRALTILRNEPYHHG